MQYTDKVIEAGFVCLGAAAWFMVDVEDIRISKKVKIFRDAKLGRRKTRIYGRRTSPTSPTSEKAPSECRSARSGRPVLI